MGFFLIHIGVGNGGGGGVPPLFCKVIYITFFFGLSRFVISLAPPPPFQFAPDATDSIMYMYPKSTNSCFDI